MVPVAKSPKNRKQPSKTASKTKSKSSKKERKFLVEEDELPDWVNDENSDQSEETLQDRHKPSFFLNPGEFEVILIVDNMEVAGGNQGGKKSRKELTIKELKANGVQFETRHLTIGDFAWIAKEKVALDPSRLRQRTPRELILPYIVERKRMDDLKQSIIDGRYKEQKLRLAQCGLRNIIYLVEGFDKQKKYWAKDSDKQPFKQKAFASAIASTSLMDG